MIRIGLAAWAMALIGGGAFADGASATVPTGERFYLNFDMLAPADLSCDATGPGVDARQTRDLAGKPVLRVTGNARGARITCERPDGSRYVTNANRLERDTTVDPIWGTVTYQRDKDAMTVVLYRGEKYAPLAVAHESFLRVVPGTGNMDSSLVSLGGLNTGGAEAAPILEGD
ncbi:hypothetical protein [Paracoccus halophilus]|nr:hypothetical protein [Paracoccus halophilus]